MDDAHDPTHQTRLPRLILGLVALVPFVSLVMALVADGATRAALGYFHVLWTALLVLIFGTWMVKNPTLTLDRKLAWGFFFVLIAPLALPLYWRRHVWRAPTSTVTHG